jgi:hypothetical protein
MRSFVFWENDSIGINYLELKEIDHVYFLLQYHKEHDAYSIKVVKTDELITFKRRCYKSENPEWYPFPINLEKIINTPPF